MHALGKEGDFIAFTTSTLPLQEKFKEVSYKRISKSTLLIPWQSWQRQSLMKTLESLTRELDISLIADLASKETG